MTRCGPDGECPAGRSCAGGFCLAQAGGDGADGGVAAQCPKATNHALSFSGGEQVRIPDSSSMRLTDITIEAWARFAGFPGQHQVIVAKPFGDDKANSFALWQQGGFLAGGVNPTLVEEAANHAFTPTLGRWYHFAFTYDHQSGTQKLYIDASLVATSTAPAPPKYDAKPTLIGADIDLGAPVGFFEGDIDEVWIWDQVRDAGEIADDKGRCLAPRMSGLSAYYSFDEGSGQRASDGSGNGNHATLGEGSGSDPRDPAWVESDVPF
jgi:hypothetical protein